MPASPPEPAPLTGDALVERLRGLDGWLTQRAPLWTPRPFVTWRPAWWDDEPELAAWVQAVDEGTLGALEASSWADADLPARLASLAAEADALTSLAPLAAAASPPAARGLKSRKGEQIGGFLSATEHALRGGDAVVVEWCAGRGHLGRTLSERLDRRALLLERDPDLCAPARGVVERPGVRHVCVDVLADAVHAALPAQAAFVGLHACGRLTDRMLDVALAHGAAAIAAAPCCAHRLFGAPHYAPRSALGRVSALTLDPSALRLSVMDDVVVSPRQRARRQREHWLRVAVDLLAREATGDDVHFSFPSLGAAEVDLPLGDFVRGVQRRHGLPLPASWDPDRVGQAATAQLRVIRAGAVVRALARRPLELWLALDRAQSLVEAGLDVHVGTFCARAATPRNVLIVARAA